MNRNIIAIGVAVVLSVTTIGFARMPRSLPVPLEIIEPGWMESRKQRQVTTATKINAFVDFSFHDRYEDSGITFSNICTDDTGLRYKPSHYDHGNGIAVADVDGTSIHGATLPPARGGGGRSSNQQRPGIGP